MCPLGERGTVHAGGIGTKVGIGHGPRGGIDSAEDELTILHADVDKHGGIAQRAGGVGALRRGVEELVGAGVENQVLVRTTVVDSDDDPRGIGLRKVGRCFVEFEGLLAVNGCSAAQSGVVRLGFGREGAVTTLVGDDIGTLSVEIGETCHRTVLDDAGVLCQIQQGRFEFCTGSCGELVVHLAEVFLHIGRAVIVELAGMGKVVLNQLLQCGEIFHLEVDFRKCHEVSSTVGEAFREIQAQELSGGEGERTIERDRLRGRFGQCVGSHRGPRSARLTGGLHLDRAGQILVGVAVSGVGCQGDALERGFAGVGESDAVGIVVVRTAAPFRVPEGGIVAVEDQFGQTIPTVVFSTGFLRTEAGYFPLRLGDFRIGVAQCGAHTLHILRLHRGHDIALHQGGEHTVGREIVGVLLIGQSYPSVVVFGFDVTAGLHDDGGFALQLHCILVTVISGSLIAAAVGVSEPELVAVVPFSALHRASKGTPIVSEVGHDALTGAAACEFFEESVESTAEILHLSGHALRRNVVPFVIDAARVVPCGNNGVLEARSVFEHDFFRTNVEKESYPVAGFPIFAVQENVHARAFTTETFGHGIGERAVNRHHTAALEIGQRFVFIGVAVVPTGEDDGTIFLAVVESTVVLNSDVAVVESEGLYIGAEIIGIGGDKHFIINPVEGISAGQIGIGAFEAIEVERRNAAPIGHVHRIRARHIGRLDGEGGHFGVRHAVA